MRRLIVRIVLAVLAAAFVAVCVIAKVRPHLLVDVRSVPMWVWRALAGTTCVVFVATWIPFKRIGYKLLLKALLRLQRIVQTPTFQKRVLPAVLRPVLYPLVHAGLVWVVWRLFTNPDKLRFANPEANEKFAQVNELLDKVKAAFEKRLTGTAPNENEKDRTIAVNRAMTWGVAGVAIVLLTTVIVATHPTTDRAALVSAACLAYAIPTLIACGFIQVSYPDTSIERPTVREVLRVTHRIYLALFFVFVGLAAMLWSYDPIVSGVFIIAVYWAYQLINRAFKARVAKPKEKPAPPQLSQNEGTATPGE
jgi:hypothetical protein